MGEIGGIEDVEKSDEEKYERKDDIEIITSKDSFLNDIYTAEGKQEVCKDSKDDRGVEENETTPEEKITTPYKEDTVKEISLESKSTDEKLTEQNKSELKTEPLQEPDEIKIHDTPEETKEKEDVGSPQKTDSLPEREEKSNFIWADEVETERGIESEPCDINIEKAEQIVEEIVMKAEKVMDQVQGKLQDDEAKKSSTESLTEFSKISQESQGVVKKLEESYSSVKVETTKEEEKSSVTISVDSFHQIEKESKEIVSKLKESYNE